MRVKSTFPKIIAALLFAAVCISAEDANPNKMKRFLSKPLVIEDQGSFYIGGIPKVTTYAAGPTAAPNQTLTPQQITIGQMYVQFQIPQSKMRNMPPVIMVHGSSHSGASLESTPDGREGWLPYFVRKGISTYIVDQSGRGRSGFDESVIHEAEAMITAGNVKGGTDMLPAIARITDSGAWTQWFGHIIPPGSTVTNGTFIRHGDPGDPPTDDASHKDNYLPAFPIPANHLALDYYKQLLPNAENTLPGSTCPTCEPTAIAPANTWTPQNLATLVEMLGGAVVATHSQSGVMGHHMVRILKERGHLNLLKGLITLEGSCSFPNSGVKAEDFDNIPYLAVKGDYTATSQVCEDSVKAINARRAEGKGIAKAEYIKLDELPNPVFRGTTHMMMIGTNSNEVADVILDWSSQNIPPKAKSGKSK